MTPEQAADIFSKIIFGNVDIDPLVLLKEKPSPQQLDAAYIECKETIRDAYFVLLHHHNLGH